MAELKSIQQMTREEFETLFPNEEACRAYLMARRWPEGVRCPRCGSGRIRPARNMQLKWKCLNCRKGGEYRFSHTAGTFFENTKAPLRTWFRILHAMLRVHQLLLQDEPVSALQVQRCLRMSCDCPYQVVWCLSQRLHAALEDSAFCALMDIKSAPFGGNPGSAFYSPNRDAEAAVYSI